MAVVVVTGSRIAVLVSTEIKMAVVVVTGS